MIVLLVLIFILAFVGLPNLGFFNGYGYGYWPSGLLGLLFIILLIWLLLGRTF